MKTIIKTIKTIVAIVSLLFALTVLFTLDNFNDITTLIGLAVSMIIGFAIGISLLINTYPSYFVEEYDYEDEINKTINEYKKEIEVLRKRELEYLQLLVKIRDNRLFAADDIKWINDEINRIKEIK